MTVKLTFTFQVDSLRLLRVIWLIALLMMMG